MKVYDKGVLITSNLYFHTPSETGKRLYFYPVCCGHYYCTSEYVVRRKNYNSFLLLHVKKGEGYVNINGRQQTISAGSSFLLDCYMPHTYGTHSTWEIIWVHFDGNMANEYYKTISPSANCRIITPPNPHNMNHSLSKIYTMFHDKGMVNEPQANKYIVSALTDFLQANSLHPKNKAGMVSEELLAYITENIQNQITLEALAKRVSLSPYHFARLFKKETGYSPYEYVLMTRINTAKYYLKSTNQSIKEITYMCGFNAESRFCTAFKNKVGVTPANYRNSAI